MSLATLPENQIYDAFYALFENNGLDPNADYGVGAFLWGATYNVFLGPAIPLNTEAAAGGRIPDPFHGTHEMSWYGLSPVYALHLVVDTDRGAEAHFDQFNGILVFPLHEIFDYLPSFLINTRSQIPQNTSSWTCSVYGGCQQ